MIYLDNGSTTPILDSIKESIRIKLDGDFGNPSSLHKLGVEAEKDIKDSRSKVAELLGVKEKTIVFTSGGSESNNHAIKGSISTFNKRGKHIITTKIEHASVYNTLKKLESKGFEVDFLGVDKNGLINLDELKSKIRKDTILVSIMHVNNEIGSVQDLEAIGKIIKGKNDRTIFHTDAVASFGKLPMEVKKWQVDLLTASGHKVYTPKGIGFLYIREGLHLDSLIDGGGHEEGRRAGTENTLGITALGEASSILYKRDTKKDIENIKALRSYAIELITKSIKDTRINGPEICRSELIRCSPYVLNISFKGLKAEVLLHYLESKDIYVSTTSACSSKSSKKESRVLDAIGVEKDYVDGSIRVTFSHYTSKDEIDGFVEVLKEGILMLRMFNK